MLESECNLIYSDNAVYILLKRKQGLTHKKGNGFYPEANAEKRAGFVE
jgi:transposase